jgi:hypothetical protein
MASMAHGGAIGRYAIWMSHVEKTSIFQLQLKIAEFDESTTLGKHAAHQHVANAHDAWAVLRIRKIGFIQSYSRTIIGEKTWQTITRPRWRYWTTASKNWKNAARFSRTWAA